MKAVTREHDGTRSPGDAHESPALPGGFDAVLLVGGAGSRLGGTDKAALALAGEPLVDHALAAASQARQLVVVGRTGATVPAGALRTAEEPPGSGPAAGFVAGLNAIGPNDHAPWTLLLACDLPGAVTGVAGLVTAAVGLDPSDDGVVVTDANGRVQWVLGLYRTAAVLAHAAGSPSWADCSLRALLGGLNLVHLAPREHEWHDVDTWEDHAIWQRRLSSTQPLGPSPAHPSPPQPSGARSAQNGRKERP